MSWHSLEAWALLTQFVKIWESHRERILLHFRHYFHRFTALWSIMVSECRTVDVLLWATSAKNLDFAGKNLNDEHYDFRESIDFHQDQQRNLSKMLELRRDRPVVWYPVTKLDQFLAAARQPLFSKVWLSVENKGLFVFVSISIWFLYFPTTNSNAVHSSHRQWI